MRRTIPAASLGLTLALLTACGSGGAGARAAAAPTAPAAVHELGGRLTLHDSVTAAFGCSAGRGGFSDVADGAQVTVTDDAGRVIGVGQLGAGFLDRSSGDCAWLFVVRGVPGAPFYGVEVSHRGAVRYSREQLETRGWSVEITLGA